MEEEAVVAAPHQAEATDSNEKNICYLVLEWSVYPATLQLSEELLSVIYR